MSGRLIPYTPPRTPVITARQVAASGGVSAAVQAARLLLKNRKNISRIVKGAIRKIRTQSEASARRAHPRDFLQKNKDTDGMNVDSISKKEMKSNGKSRLRTRARVVSRSSKGRKTSKGSGRKSSKRRKVTSESAFLRKGYVQTIEYGGIEAAANCAYVGHGSAPALSINQNVFCALVKSVFALMHVNIVSMKDTVPTQHQDLIFTFNVENRVTGATASGHSYGPIGAVTYLAIANDFANWFAGWAPSASVGNEIYEANYFEAASSPTDSAKNWRIWLKDCYVEHVTISKLKLQNRSLITDTAGTQENALNVDNVPVIGRCYTAKGTGFVYKGHISNTGVGTRPFFEDFTYGHIVKDAAENEISQLNEPPHKSMFDATSYGVKMMPGEVKTHTLVFKRKRAKFYDFLLNLRLTGSVITSTGTIRKGYGEVTMYALEHLLKTTTDGVTIAFEVNCKHMTRLRQSFAQRTAADWTNTIAASS